MHQLNSMEKDQTLPCPYLPPHRVGMSYKDLRAARTVTSDKLFRVSLEYAQFLWMDHKPARAILALCRALYLDPESLKPATVAPYRAYGWLLLNHRGNGFLGNPRISFFHQATRMNPAKPLFRQRAWAMWHVTVEALPNLPPDTGETEPPLSLDSLAGLLDRNGLQLEGERFMQALVSIRAGNP